MYSDSNLPNSARVPLFGRLRTAIQRRPRTAAVVAAALMWIPLVVKSIRNALEEGGNDFTILHRVGLHVLSGEPVYDGYYVYPPAFAVGMAGIALLPYTVGALVWTLSKVALAIYTARVFTRGLSAGWALFWIAVGPALLFRSFESDLVTGNSNTLLLGGVAFAVDIASRPRRSGWAGVLLGLVASVKLSPAYLLLAAGAARRFWICGTGFAVLLAVVAGASLIVVDGGAGSRSGFFGTSTTVFEADEVDLDAGRTGYLPGQSVRALVHRLTRPIDATAHDRGKFVAIHWIDVGRAEIAEWIYRGLAVLFGLGGLLWIIGRRADFPWAMAFGSCVLLWISPYSRKAHFVLLLPAVLMTIEQLHASRSSRSRSAIVLLVIALGLGPLTSKDLWGRELSAWLVAHCPFGIATILVALALILSTPTTLRETRASELVLESTGDRE